MLQLSAYLSEFQCNKTMIGHLAPRPLHFGPPTPPHFPFPGETAYDSYGHTAPASEKRWDFAL